MPESPLVSLKILDTLRQLGLGEYAARCYVALLPLGAAEASAIASAADVPRTKVYVVLRDLVDAGWVVAEGGRPHRYRAVAPAERIPVAERALIEDTEAATRELQARHVAGADMLPVSLFLLRGDAAILAKSLELVERARAELMLNLGFLLPGEAKALHDAVARARRRGVAVRLLVNTLPGPGTLEGIARFEAMLPDARRAIFPWRAVIVDHAQALIVLPAPPGAPAEERHVALWNPSREFMQAVEPMLRAMWEAAPPYLSGPG